jgi:hypothetical protein
MAEDLSMFGEIQKSGHAYRQNDRAGGFGPKN